MAVAELGFSVRREGQGCRLPTWPLSVCRIRNEKKKSDPWNGGSAPVREYDECYGS